MSTRTRDSIQERTADASKRGVTAWATFTWATDTNRAFRIVPHVLLNWLVLASLVYGWWSLWDTQWRLMLRTTLLGLLYTTARAARWVPKTRETVLSLYTSTAKTCGHPRITRANPVDPRTRVKVTRWGGPKKPQAGLIAYESDSPAAARSTRSGAVKTLDAAPGDEGGVVVLD